MAKDWAVPRYIQKVSSPGKVVFQGRKFLFPRLERNFRLEKCALILQQQLTELVLSGHFVGDALG